MKECMMKKYLIALAVVVAAPVAIAQDFVMDEAQMNVQPESWRARAERYGRQSYDWAKKHKKPLIAGAVGLTTIGFVSAPLLRKKSVQRLWAKKLRGYGAATLKTNDDPVSVNIPEQVDILWREDKDPNFSNMELIGKEYNASGEQIRDLIDTLKTRLSDENDENL